MKKLMILFLAIGIVINLSMTSVFAKKIKKEKNNTEQTVELKNTQNALNQEFKMPTDEEIKSVLEQFNFDEKQKEYLFKETKKTFEEMQEQNSQK